MEGRGNPGLRGRGERSRRPRRGTATALALAGLLSAPLVLPALAFATVYKWIDENGLTHYTTDPEKVPRHLRGHWKEPETVPEVAPPSVRELDPEGLYSIPGPRTAPGRRPIQDDDDLATLPAVSPGAEPPPATSGGPADTETTVEVPTAEAHPPATPSPPPVESPPSPIAAEPPAEGTRIAELEAKIARDRDLLKQLLTSDGNDGAWLRDPRLRDVAERLSRLQRELDSARTRGGL